MSKQLCKLVKNGMVKDDPKKYLKLIKKAQFYCKKCGRVAADKGDLCKSEKL